MICDEDPLRRRPRESTARRKRQERCVWMARKMTEWPSKRGPITKIMPSDGCIGDTAPLAVGKWYDFHEFGWYMGNVGQTKTAAHFRPAVIDQLSGEGISQASSPLSAQIPARARSTKLSGSFPSSIRPSASGPVRVFDLARYHDFRPVFPAIGAVVGLIGARRRHLVLAVLVRIFPSDGFAVSSPLTKSALDTSGLV